MQIQKEKNNTWKIITIKEKNVKLFNYVEKLEKVINRLLNKYYEIL